MEFEVRSMSSAYAITEIFSLGFGEVAPNCESCNCFMRSFINVAKITGDRTEPCRTPFSTVKRLLMNGESRIADLELS